MHHLPRALTGDLPHLYLAQSQLGLLRSVQPFASISAGLLLDSHQSLTLRNWQPSGLSAICGDTPLLELAVHQQLLHHAARAKPGNA
jgi:hypothetical protein